MPTEISSRRRPRRKKSRRLPRLKKGRRAKSVRPRASARCLSGRATASVANVGRESQLLLRVARPALSGAHSSNVERESIIDAKTDAPPTRCRTPEEKELNQKHAQLRVLEAELTRQEGQLANLRADVGPFEERYIRKIGVRWARLDEIEALIAEAEARRQPGNPVAQQAADRARERAERSRAAVLRHIAVDRPDPPAALKRLYRAVARRVHPDFGEDPTDRQVRGRLMAHANRAYQRYDERRLRGILAEYEFGPESVRGEGTPLELVRVIRRIALIRGRLTEIEQETEQTRNSDLYHFKARAEAAAEQGRDLFAEIAATVAARIASARQKLRSVSAAAPSR